MSQNDKNQLSGDECLLQFFEGTNLRRNENRGFERLERLERKGNKECVCIISAYLYTIQYNSGSYKTVTIFSSAILTVVYSWHRNQLLNYQLQQSLPHSAPSTSTLLNQLALSSTQSTTPINPSPQKTLSSRFQTAPTTPPLSGNLAHKVRKFMLKGIKRLPSCILFRLPLPLNQNFGNCTTPQLLRPLLQNDNMFWQKCTFRIHGRK